MTNSVYIHIPFCKSICSYCDFCKIYYDEKICRDYLDSLRNEINLRYKGEKVETVYIGGGTPSSLSLSNVEYLFDIIEVFDIENLKEFTFEFNVLDINRDILELLKKNHVNRISIGIETINREGQLLLNRVYSKEEISERINLAKEYFDNINLDLIYAYKDETIDILKEDLDFITSFNPTHISTYSLIIEEHTELFNKGIVPIDEELDSKMYDYIRKYLKDLGYNHIEISNFAKEGYRPLHNLVYWNNEHYYGFGAGASGYIDNTRYTNTKSVFKYNKGIYDYESNLIDRNTDIENEIMLGLRKIEGINKKVFKEKFGVSIEDLYEIDKYIKLGYLEENNDYIYIPSDKLYISNSIIMNFIGGIND